MKSSLLWYSCKTIFYLSLPLSLWSVLYLARTSFMFLQITSTVSQIKAQCLGNEVVKSIFQLQSLWKHHMPLCASCKMPLEVMFTHLQRVTVSALQPHPRNSWRISAIAKHLFFECYQIILWQCHQCDRNSYDDAIWSHQTLYLLWITVLTTCPLATLIDTEAIVAGLNFLVSLPLTSRYDRCICMAAFRG